MSGEAIKLAGFELIERLGLGGMGVVWKARQLSLDRMVAIKLVRAESIRSQEDVKQIIQEARTAAKLKHPGIVQVYDACEQNGAYFLVMEYVDGYTIGQWLKRRKQLPVKEVLLIAESVATALEYAWQTAGLIHCDIKPENVMVDQDGTIKVADLGLSLTKDSKAGEHEDEITGTPGYMSPEQVRGDMPLDCRTDIYSLGATLYELLTGIRPFSDKSDAEAMECQLTDKICDPRDVVPGVPLSVCMLLERMLVKDRDGRLADWTKVLSDIRRVSKGVLPSSPAPANGSSTLAVRRPAAPERGKGEPVEVKAPKRSGGKMIGPLFTIFLMLAGFAGYMMWSESKAPVAEPELPALMPVPIKGLVAEDKEAAAAQWLETARRWSKSHPGAYELVIRRFQGVIDSFPGTAAARSALEEIEQTHLRRERDRQQAWKMITGKADELVKSSGLKAALVFVEQYRGAFALETESNRMVLARGLRQKLADGEVDRVEDEAWHGFVDRIAGVLISGKVQTALDDVATAGKSGRFAKHGEALDALDAVLKEARAASAGVLESYRGEVGKVMVIRLGRGDLKVQVTGISDGKVVATMADAGTQISFNPDDLPLDERLRRMGNPDSPGAALAKGLVAVAGRDFQAAGELFPRTGPVLSVPMMEKLQDAKSARTEEELMASLAKVLRMGGVTVGPYDEAGWVKAVEQARLTREQAAVLNEQREKFLVDFGMSEFAVKAAPVLLVLEQRCVSALQGEPSAVRAGEVAAVTNGTKPKVDIASVCAKFRKQNHGVMEESVTVYTVNSGGIGIKVVSDSVVNLSALTEDGVVQGVWLETVRAQNAGLDFHPLSNSALKELRIKGYSPKDISAFRGMELKHLTLIGVNAASFSALEGLPLVELDLTASSIRDLNPLRGMRLESLNLNGTKVVSLMVLAGMPLRTLNCRGVPVRDISVLRGLPLESLDLSETTVMDYAPLKGLSIKNLSMAKTQVKDIGFCAQMPLETLDLGDTPVSDISAIRGKNMRRLILARTGVRDIAPLIGSSIDTLDLSGTRIPLLTLPQALAKIRFKDIALDYIELPRIECLRGKDLRRVSIAGTKVSDLSPLANMSIRMLNVKGLRIDDASPIGTLASLEELWCDLDPLQEQVLLTDLPNLKRVNGRSRESVANPEARQR